MKKSLKAIWIILQIVLTICHLHAARGEAPMKSKTEPSEGAVPTWAQWVEKHLKEESLPNLQERLISKSGRFQVIGPMFGFSERKDFYNVTFFSISNRYHFTEEHGWEFLRVTRSFPKLSQTAREVQKQTSFTPDAQPAQWQFSSAYVFSPVYGKYAWGGQQVIHFDVFTTLGLGLRFAKERQPFGEGGVGMNHFLNSQHLTLVPEFRLRMYSEKRSESVLVFESLFGLGIAWLF